MQVCSRSSCKCKACRKFASRKIRNLKDGFASLAFGIHLYTSTVLDAVSLKLGV